MFKKLKLSKLVVNIDCAIASEFINVVLNIIKINKINEIEDINIYFNIRSLLKKTI